jgi:tRNA pseudouridine38-40 synthase
VSAGRSEDPADRDPVSRDPGDQASSDQDPTDQVPASQESDDEGPLPQRFRLLVAYDGARFHGWQYQPGLCTVQGEIERALTAITGSRSAITGAGRTDAGVHALGQVASFTAQTRLEPARLRLALNAHLPPDIRIHACAEAPPDFSARFQAHWRHYHYVLMRRASPFWRGRATVPRFWPELAPMTEATAVLLGEHEFRAFTTQPEGPFGCCIRQASWREWGEGYVFSIRSNRFLYQMVRIIVGTLLEVGRGRWQAADVRRILQGMDRRAAGPLAPACGLYFACVGYDPPWPSPDSAGAEAGGPEMLPIL